MLTILVVLTAWPAPVSIMACGTTSPPPIPTRGTSPFPPTALTPTLCSVVLLSPLLIKLVTVTLTASGGATDVLVIAAVGDSRAVAVAQSMTWNTNLPFAQIMLGVEVGDASPEAGILASLLIPIIVSLAEFVSSLVLGMSPVVRSLKTELLILAGCVAAPLLRMKVAVSMGSGVVPEAWPTVALISLT